MLAAPRQHSPARRPARASRAGGAVRHPWQQPRATLRFFMMARIADRGAVRRRAVHARAARHLRPLRHRWRAVVTRNNFLSSFVFLKYDFANSSARAVRIVLQKLQAKENTPRRNILCIPSSILRGIKTALQNEIAFLLE